MKALKSNFYLIRLDNTPVYVGYTNRPIKTRFREHLHDKDFGDGEVTQESLGSMSFDFTWDINLINQYAKEVSDRETNLIAEYGTATSIWQKGFNGLVGGTVWSDIKHFVSTNRNSPKFAGLSEDEILSYLQQEDIVRQYMSSFVSNMNTPIVIYMSSFVDGIRDPVASYMHTFVNHIQNPVASYMSSFISTLRDHTGRYMADFVNGMKLPGVQYMKSFVSTMILPEEQYMKSFVTHMSDPTDRYMKSFVTHMSDPTDRYMADFVTNMNKKS